MTFTPRTRWKLTGAIAAVAAAGVAMAAPKKPPEKQPEPAPQSAALRPLMRELIQREMSQHAMAASDTWWNAIDLRFDAARASAQELVDAPVLAQTSQPGTVNAEVPPRFFELQTSMRNAAKDVALAAGNKDAKAMGAAAGRLTESCVACHAEFRPRGQQ